MSTFVPVGNEKNIQSVCRKVKPRSVPAVFVINGDINDSVAGIIINMEQFDGEYFRFYERLVVKDYLATQLRGRRFNSSCRLTRSSLQFLQRAFLSMLYMVQFLRMKAQLQVVTAKCSELQAGVRNDNRKYERLPARVGNVDGA